MEKKSKPTALGGYGRREIHVHVDQKLGELAIRRALGAEASSRAQILTEAVENAVRLAKGHTGRMKVLSAYRSYHGGTAAAIGLTGEPRRLENEPSIPGLVKFWGPYPYRSAFHAGSAEQECERALQHLRDTVVFEGPSKVAAIILESVVGTNGVRYSKLLP